MALQIIGKLLRHGQIFLVYPSAFLERPRHVDVPSEFHLEYEDLPVRTSDGVTLSCYLLRYSVQRQEQTEGAASRSARATVIMFHGNGMNLGDCIPSAMAFLSESRRCNVLMVSYRGYAHSDGVPSESGLRKDAQAALDYLTSESEFSQIPIILFGQSLGGSVAIDLASRNPSTIKALIIENTFTSLPDIVRGWPMIGRFSFLVHQKWNSASKIPLIPPTLPILMLSGVMDEVVPQKHMKALWEKAKQRHGSTTETAAGGAESNMDQFKEYQFGYHSSTCYQPGYWFAVEDFLNTLNLP